MERYHTKQRDVLLSFLSRHADEQLTARRIAEGLKDADISQSAVYRNLAALESDGQVRRSAASGSREVYYQYIGADCCKGRLHLSCKKCGKTYHMERPAAEQLIQDVALAEGFAVDQSETILYGLCRACQK